MSKDSARFSVDSDALHSLIADVDDGSRQLRTFGGVNGLAKLLKTDIISGRADSKETLQARKAAFGVNELPPAKDVTFLELVMEALGDRMLQLLIGSAVISLILGLTVPNPHTGEVDYAHGWIEGTAILASVVIVTLVTSINNYQKELKFKELSACAPPVNVTVTRNGGKVDIEETQLLVGDVLFVSGGMIVPADGILIRGQQVKVDESAATGENDDVEKSVEENPFFRSGSNVLEGEGYILVTGVGENSFQGRISMQVREEKADTPLQEALEELADKIGQLGMFAAGAMFIVLSCMELYSVFVLKLYPLGYKKFLDMITTSVTIVVVAVPEGLPLSVTIALAYSMKQMFKENNFVRHLAACETMGGATTICTDKTGTLTLNEMSVTAAWMNGQAFESRAAKLSAASALGGSKQDALLDLSAESIAINTSASKKRIVTDEKTKSSVTKYVGNKTEQALLLFTEKFGKDPMTLRAAVDPSNVHSYPFTSAKKRMTTAVRSPSKSSMRFHVKGASEMVLADCDTIFINGSVEPLSEKVRQDLTKAINQFARNRLRTIAIAIADASNTVNFPKDDTNIPPLTLLCIVGIEDPIRPEVPDAVRQCKIAGVTVRMVTGDNKATAISIAKQAGIYCKVYAGSAKGEDGLAMEGRIFREIAKSKNRLDSVLPRLQVLARASPLDKQILVAALMKRGEVVAVTGDGTNDAPALKNANVGFAMNSGTEVAKKASDVVILDDNFRSIVTAMKWGRNVNDNISKFIQFQTTVNVAAVTTAFVGAIFSGNHESPLKPVQLLWLNLIMDTMAALALATESPSETVLHRPPRGKTAPLISRRMWVNIIGQAIYQIVLLLWLLHAGFKWFRTEQDSDIHMTLIFNVFVLLQVTNEFNARILDNKLNVFSGLLGAPMFLLIIVITIVVQILGVSYFGTFMKTVPLSPILWRKCVQLSLVPLPLGFILRLIPVTEPPLPDPEPEEEEGEKEGETKKKPLVEEVEDDSYGKISWQKGHKFAKAAQIILTQLKVVGALAAAAQEAESRDS